MGKGASRLVSLKEARSRVDPQDWGRWERGFDTLSGQGRLGDVSFRESVLGPQVPRDLASRIFTVFDHGKKGFLDMDDFLIAMTVLTQGTHEEHLKCVVWLGFVLMELLVLFNFYDLEDDGKLSRVELERCIEALKEILVTMKHKTAVQISDSIFTEVID
jgi:Ca2+-binding EF-hand superfamily protein